MYIVVVLILWLCISGSSKGDTRLVHDAQFWSSQPDPVLIERGQTKGIQLVRSMVNPTMTTYAAAAASSNITQPGEPTEANMTDTSRVPCIRFVHNKGLEEQFLTGDEASQDVMDIAANWVTTPVENDAAPLNPIYTQRSQQDKELDLQLSRGPRDESLGEVLDKFLDDNYEDILRTLNIQTNFSISGSNQNITGRPMLPLGWIVPDGTNRSLEEILIWSDLSNDPFHNLSLDLFVNLVFIAFISHSWNELLSLFIWVSIFVPFWSLYLPVAASTKDVLWLMSNACLNASSSISMYKFFVAIFLNNLSLVFAGNFFAYSTITVLLSCSLGDILNATLWIASYLCLNVTNGLFMENCMFCSLVAASVLLGISE